MTLLLILCHPKPGSLNHFLAERARELLERWGHKVFFHDLYAEGFDPVLTGDELARRYSFDGKVQRHIAELTESEGLVLFHPDWWGQPPAMLKGWVDRVFKPGVAYELEGGEFERKRSEPLLAGKQGLVFATSDEPEGDGLRRLRELWTNSILGFCGMLSECVVLPEVFASGPKTRLDWVRLMEGKLADWFPRVSLKAPCPDSPPPASSSPRSRMRRCIQAAGSGT